MKVYFDNPAGCWHEAFPLGNGRIGAMFGGGTSEETIYLNEDTLWSGYPADTHHAPAEGFVEEIRDLAGRGDYGAAMEKIEKQNEVSQDCQMYVPFGNLKLQFLGERRISGYKRSLDLTSGIVQAEYCADGKRERQECFCSAEHDGVHYYLSLAEKTDIYLYFSGGYLQSSAYDGDFLIGKGECPGRNPFTVTEGVGGKAKPFFSEKEEERGMRYAGIAAINAGAARKIPFGQGVKLCGCEKLHLYISIHSSYRDSVTHPYLAGIDPVERCMEDINKLGKTDYETVREAHTQSFSAYMNRTRLRIGGAEQAREFEMEDMGERLSRYGERAERGEDLELPVLLFEFGKYLMVSSSRPGTQAANGQGIWNKELIPPWNSYYTANINVEMNYWLNGPCALFEMDEPFYRLCREIMEDGRKTAKAYWNAGGVCAYSNIDLWRKTSPATGHATWAFWPFGFAWMCKNLMEHYYFTEDNQYLRDTAYPILRENVRFCLDTLTEKDGYYLFSPGTSPENNFIWKGKRVSVALYSENETAIIRNLFRDFILCCERLGVKDSLYKETAERLPFLMPIRIGSRGQVLEWNEEFQEADRQHRHLSHLYELYPGDGITEETAELQKAARTTLIDRGDNGSGWSIAWKILMWARLGEGERALKLADRFLSLSTQYDKIDVVGGDGRGL
ncbi:MAG: glycoside hydrolase family 95 protein [Clostridium sp.]|nr:glycoside hydrolase family 95 protein [Clostridium sp.]